MSTHGRTVCSCGAVIMQCRCPGPHGPDKVVQQGCSECKRKVPLTGYTDIDEAALRGPHQLRHERGRGGGGDVLLAGKKLRRVVKLELVSTRAGAQLLVYQVSDDKKGAVDVYSFATIGKQGEPLLDVTVLGGRLVRSYPSAEEYERDNPQQHFAERNRQFVVDIEADRFAQAHNERLDALKSEG